jgi:sugar phosphate isomerase/epimerase
MGHHVSRRSFLGTTAAATAATFVPSPGAAASAGMFAAASRLTLGVASYSMREFTLDRVLEMAKTLGVTSMTFKDVHLPRTDPPENTRALSAKIRAAGIRIAGGGTINMANDPVQIKKDFEYAKNAGFPLIYISPEPAALDPIEQMAKTYDIRVAIHNHGPEDKLWPRPEDAYAAIKSRDQRLGLCIDVGHTIRTGTDPAKACRECRDRLYDMHVKDLTSATDKDSQTEVGRGVIDYPTLFRTLIEIGYRGQVGLEYEINSKNPLPGMIESMAYMRGVLAALPT